MKTLVLTLVLAGFVAVLAGCVELSRKSTTSATGRSSATPMKFGASADDKK